MRLLEKNVWCVGMAYRTSITILSPIKQIEFIIKLLILIYKKDSLLHGNTKYSF